MKQEPEIITMLQMIMTDDRLWYPTANVFDNAPLALVQVDLRSKADMLCWVLGITFAEAKEKYHKGGN